MKIQRRGSIGMKHYLIVFFSLFVIHLCANANAATPSSYDSYMSSDTNDEIKVGVILDMGSWTGKTIHSCIAMAISDFYASRSHYKTRLVLHTRDSQGDPLHAISAALDLVESVEVQTMIIGPLAAPAANLLAVLGKKAKVPIFSFSSIFSSFDKYPFVVQIKQDETTQFKGIAAILNSFNWKSVNIVYEDSDDGTHILSKLADSIHEAKIHISHRSAISSFSTDDQIVKELHKLMALKPSINVVHSSPSLASRVFLIAKRLGMMEKGYAWIITDMTMNLLHTLDSEVIDSLQGALGLKAYIPSSSKLRDLTLRWRKEFYSKDPIVEPRKLDELDVLGIWAYDTMWALAESFEKIGAEFSSGGDLSTGFKSSSQKLACFPVSDCGIGTRLLNEIERIRLTGLSGEFQVLNGRLYSESYVIANVLGKGERKIGFWTPKVGITKEINPSVGERNPSLGRGLEAVIWPGGSTVAPKERHMLTRGKKLRIGVPNNPGFPELMKVYRDPQTNQTSVTGFCFDVFDAAIKSLDYEVPYEFIPYVDEKGVNLGSYTELVNQVYLQNYDGVVGDITITANRSLYVDFTSPYTDLGFGTITKRQGKGMWVFSKPFDGSLWLTSGGFFVLLGLVVWAIEHPTNEEFQGPIARQIWTILWFGFSTLVFAHREKLTNNLSRFAVIVWLFVVLILTSSYTATLSSMLTVRQIQLASVEDYVGTQYSFVGGLIASNLNFKDNLVRRYKSPKEYADALSKGSKNGGVAAIVNEIPYIKIFLAKYAADYAMVASASTTNGFAFAFQKNSPLVSDLSQAIMKLREERKLEMMEKKWFKSEASFLPEDASSMPNILDLNSFGGLFLISCISFALALLLHLILMQLQRLQLKNNIITLSR